MKIKTSWKLAVNENEDIFKKNNGKGFFCRASGEKIL